MFVDGILPHLVDAEAAGHVDHCDVRMTTGAAATVTQSAAGG
jgi:hypothetical protein